MATSRLKTRILLPTALALVVLLAAFVLIIHRIEQKNVMEKVESSFKAAQNLFHAQLETDTAMMGAVLDAIIINKDFKAAMLAQDRQRLLTLSAPLFRELRQDHDITHLYFTGPDRVNLLRVHKPDEYGDTINRFTTLQAEKTSNISSGIELGPLGTFTLRVVMPWQDGQRLLGYVELGEEIEHIIHKLAKILKVEVFVVIDKEFLDHRKWEAGMRMLGRAANWDQFPNVVITYQTQETLPESLVPYLDEAAHTSGVSDVQAFLQGRRYCAKFLHLPDASGRGVGDMVIMEDVTAQFANLRMSFLLGGIVSFGVAALLMTFFYELVGRIEQKLDAAQQLVLELERDRSKFILDHLPAHISVLDAAGCFTQWSPYSEHLFGYSPAEAIGKLKPWDLIADHEEAADLAAIANREACVAQEIKGRRQDRSFLWVRFRIVPMTEADGSLTLLNIIEDITGSNKAEEERRRLISAIEQSAETILITDPQGAIQYVNPAFESTSGYSREEVMGQNLSILNSGKQDDSFYLRLWETVTRGEVWTGHFINRKRDGTLYEEEASISPVRDRAGQIINYVAVKRDVTQEVKLERQLRQTQKMEAIGTLAGGIAHDFNNILSIIRGYAEMAGFDLPADAPMQEEFQGILNACQRGKDLTSQILTFSRQGDQERKPMQINLIIREALKMLRATLPATIEIRQNLNGQAAILVDPTQLHQIIINLCTNACQAMNGEGILEVSLSDVYLDELSAAHHPNLRPGPYLKLVVSDTGQGMDRDTLERIFEPYFTTKPPGQGTGMGLAVVHGIVKNYGGAITVYSEAGKGSVFKIYLPKADTPQEFAPEETSLELPTGKERILFVDDEEVLASIGRRMLERLGYEVEPQTSSVKALNHFQAQPDRYDLVITDQTMPNLTGIELTRKLLDIRPDLPIILCTGFSENVMDAEAKSSGIRKFLMKPIAMPDMARIVRQVLDQK